MLLKIRNLSQSLGEIDLDGVKYLHKQDEGFDYLMDISENEVKIHLKFTKNHQKRNEAKNAIKTFLLEIL